MRNLLNANAWLGLCLAVFLAPEGYGACTYSISPASRSHGYGAATNTFTVNAGTNCTWDVTNLNAWINILSGSNGSGTGTVTYAVVANPTINSRTGTVTIAGQAFNVQQDGLPCTYSISPATTTRGYSGISNNPIFTVSSPIGCVWGLLNSNSWINFPGVTNGSGTNSVTYSIAANRTPLERTGMVAVVDQTFTVVQHAAPCIYDLNPTNRLHGYAGSTGLVTVTITSSYGSCDWFVNNTNPWITITANPSGTGSGTFGYSVAANPNSTSRTGSFMVWDQGFTVLQNPAPCSYSISPTSSSPGADSQTNIVTVTAIGGCAWGVTNTNSWISLVPTNGVGNGTVTYITAANPAMVGRTGVVSIAGQNFTVRQDAATCTYKLSPTNHIHGYGATTSSVNLSTLSVCPWDVVNTNNWVTILTPTNGTGGTDVTYALLQNNGANDRTGTLLIAGQPFFLTQHGIGCAINLSPASRNHGYGVATNTVSINIGAGCPWNVINTNSWITFLDATNGTGTNVITYAVTANPASSSRGGYITINEGLVLITQSAAPCTYSITPQSFSQNAVPQTNTVNVTSPIGCTWTVDNTNSWVTISSATNGSGSTGVIYQVAANLNSNSRTGSMTIAGQLFSVIQNGVTCTYKLSPTNRTHGYAATSNTISVTVSNPCPWFVDNTNSWITILSGNSGAGTGTVSYAVSGNLFSPDDRVGSIVIGGQVCTITQHGIPCSYSVSPTTRTHGYGAASNSFGVITTNGCAWAVGNTNTWITITAGSNGLASDTVGYTIDANISASDRVGVLTVDSQTFTITQRSATCSFDLSPTTRNHGYGSATNIVSVSTTDGCGWAASTTNTWLMILSGVSGSGTGTVTYAVASNIDTAPRIGALLIGDQNFVVNQAAYLCTYKLSPTNRTHGFGANTGLVSITAGPSCAWSITTTNDWITITSPTNGAGNGSFTYNVVPNSGTATRTGAIVVADQVLILSQLSSTDGFAFDSLTMTPSGDVDLKLNGGPPGIWQLQASTNLINWTKIADLTNNTGRVEYIVPGSAGGKRFYRAVLP